MRPITFLAAESQETVNHTDWKSVEQNDTPGASPSPDKDELDREKGKIHFTVRVKPKKKLKKPGQSGEPASNTELHRNTGRTDYSGDPYDQPVLFDQPSPSTREFMYAPGDHGMTSGLRAEADTLYQDETTTDFVPKKEGYLDREEDSNFSHKPKSWRFKTKHDDLKLVPGQNGEQDPPDWSVVEQGEMMLPLTSAHYVGQLIFAAPADFVPEEYQFSMPRQQGEGTKAWKAFRSFVTKHGEEQPRYVVDFFLVQPKGKRSFVLDKENIGVSFYNAESPTETETEGMTQGLAAQVAKFLPSAVVYEAAKAMTSGESLPTTGVPKKSVSYEAPKEKGAAKQPTPEEQELEKANQANKKAAAELKKKELEQKQKKLQMKEQEHQVDEQLQQVKLERKQQQLQKQREKIEKDRQKAEVKGPGELGTEEIPVPAKQVGETEGKEEPIPEDETAVADEIFGNPK
jgi:hypothetical protein